MKTGRVNQDLISSVDVLPTLCEAAGIDNLPKNDGVSFLPQLLGEPGTPRPWLYHWYSPRQNANSNVREFAFNHHYKLYRHGDFFDLIADPFEEQALPIDALQGEAAAAAKQLQTVLDQFQDARPAELDRQFDKSKPAGEGKKKKKKKAARDA
jgi:arylsulfatase A